MPGIRRTKFSGTVQLQSKGGSEPQRVSCSKVRGQGVGGSIPRAGSILRRESTLVHMEGFRLADPPARPLGFCLIDFPVWKFAEMRLAPVSAGIKTQQRTCYRSEGGLEGRGFSFKESKLLRYLTPSYPFE